MITQKQSINTKNIFGVFQPRDLLQENQLNIEAAVQELDLLFNSSKEQQNLKIAITMLTQAERQYEKLILNYMHLNQQDQHKWQGKIRTISIKLRNRQNKIRNWNRPETDIISQEVWEKIQNQKALYIYKLKGVLGIVGSFLIHLLIGTAFRWNIINAYVTSYYKLHDDQSLTINGDIICSTLSMVAIGITMRVGVILSKYLGVIPICLLSVMGMTLAVFLSSLMPSIWLFVLFNVLTYGLFAGLIFSTPMQECLKFFPNSRIYVNTLIQVGAALGTLLFGIQNTQCMNPKFLFPSGTGYFVGELWNISLRLPRCIRNMSIFVLIVGLLATFFLSLIVENNKQKEEFQKDLGLTEQGQKCCKTHKEALTSRIFWKMALILLLSSCGNYFVLSNYKSLVSKNFPDEKFMNIVICIGLLFNAIFRVFWGVSFKKIGFKLTFSIAMLLNIVVFLTIQTAALSKISYLLLFGLSCAILGGLIIIFINLNMLVFGQLIGQQTFSYFWLLFCFSNFLNFLFCYYLQSIIQFQGILVICSVFSLVALVMAIKIEFKGQWDNEMTHLGNQNLCIQ